MENIAKQDILNLSTDVFIKSILQPDGINYIYQTLLTQPTL
jgi:hypothetical protein